MSASGKVMVLLGDMQQITGAAKLSQQFVRAVRQHVSPSALTVLSLDEAVGWYWGAYPKETFRSESRQARLDRNLRYLLKTLQIGLTQKPGFVFCMNGPLSVPGFLLMKLVKSKYAVFAYDLRTWNSPASLVQKGLKNASYVVAISNDTRRRVLAHLSIEPDKVFILSPPVDGERFHPIERKAGLIEKYGLGDHKVLLCVGRLAPAELDGKGYETLIHALTRVIGQLPNVKLLFVGSGKGDRRLRDLAAQLGVEKQVVFAGCISEEIIPDYYNICDLFVLPSKQEGFGMVYTEALACGRPVIGAAARGTLDALLDGQLGLLVRPDDATALAEAIIRMLRREVEPYLLDPTYLRETVLAHYGFERFTEQVGELLETMGRNSVTTARSQG